MCIIDWCCHTNDALKLEKQCFHRLLIFNSENVKLKSIFYLWFGFQAVHKTSSSSFFQPYSLRLCRPSCCRLLFMVRAHTACLDFGRWAPASCSFHQMHVAAKLKGQKAHDTSEQGILIYIMREVASQVCIRSYGWCTTPGSQHACQHIFPEQNEIFVANALKCVDNKIIVWVNVKAGTMWFINVIIIINKYLRYVKFTLWILVR